jgi:DNA replication and repair protein RecF
MEHGLRDIQLTRLSLYQFKCYPEAHLTFSSPVVCFLGHNGAGKTNLLDAIHYLSFSKSYFNSVDAQNISSDKEECSITGEFVRGGQPELISCAWRKGQRKVLRRNQKEYDKLAQHIGLLPAVMITPYDVDLILEGSEVRRRFIDSTLSQISPAYLDHLVQYNQALQQRNALLKQLGRSVTHDLTEPWDHQLAVHGEAIYAERSAFIEAFLPLFVQVYREISGGRETPSLRYSSDLHSGKLMDQLRDTLERDKALERTTKGIHKDELEFDLDDRMIRKFGSQGQQKSFLISLKLAQLMYLRDKSGMNPLLMLDDLYDKLDESRVHNLLRWIHDHHQGQLFITDTHPDRIPNLLKGLHISHEVWDVDQAACALKFRTNEAVTEIQP